MADLGLKISLTADASKATIELARLNQAHQALVKALQGKIGQIGALETAQRDLAALAKALDEAKRKRDFFLRSAEVGGDAGLKLYRRDIEAAKAAVSNAAGAFERQRAAVASLSGALRTAGVDTAKLAAEKARLTRQLISAQAQFRFESAGLTAFSGGAGKATAALRPLAATMQGAALTAAQFKDGLRDVGHRMAFMAGDALLMAKAVQGVRAVLDVGTTFQRLGTTLEFATGSTTAAGEAMAYVRDTATALGLPIDVVGRGFAKLAASARGTALEGQGVRDVFTAFASAARAMGLSTADLDGVLLALGQMMSKGVVSAEELRGQLGERLPGAFQMAAEAMGVTTAELGKMLEQGQIATTDLLPRMAAVLQQRIAGALPAATKTFEAELARLKNAVTEFGNEVAQSGALEGFTTLVREAAAEMRRMAQTGELKAFAKDLAEALRDAASVLSSLTRFAVEHHEAVKNLIIAYAALRVAMYGAGLLKAGKALVDLGSGFLAARGGAAAATGALSGIGGGADAAAVAIKALGFGLQALPFAVATAGAIALTQAMGDAADAAKRLRENRQRYEDEQQTTAELTAPDAGVKVQSQDALRAMSAYDRQVYAQALDAAEQHYRALGLLEASRLGEITRTTRERHQVLLQGLRDIAAVQKGEVTATKENAATLKAVLDEKNEALKSKLATAVQLFQQYQKDIEAAQRATQEGLDKFAQVKDAIKAPKPNPLTAGTVLEPMRRTDRLQQDLADLQQGRGGDPKQLKAEALAILDLYEKLKGTGKATDQYLLTQIDRLQELYQGAADEEQKLLAGNEEAARQAATEILAQMEALKTVPVGLDMAAAVQSAEAVRQAVESVLAANPVVVPVVTSAQMTAMASESQNAAVPAKKYSTGGLVLGPGTDTSDSILARLSRREYVIRAPSVRAVGARVLDYINRFGQLPRFALGGLVERAATIRSQVPAAAAAGLPLTINLADRSFGATMAADVRRDFAAELQREVLRRGRR